MRLSKSRYVTGLQCPKRLWWTVHEPDAPELQSDDAADPIIERGHRVGALARTYVPGGRLIDLPHHAYEERIEATRRALADKVPAIYEAAFFADDIFVSIDILERRKRGFVLAEVKSTTKVKPVHQPDVAVQLHVARRAGLTIERAEVMHLNPECRHPDLRKLFLRKAVTKAVGPHLRAVPKRAGEMLSMLARPLPEHPVGEHCSSPYECPFVRRCSAEPPEHHVGTLYQIRTKKTFELMAEGIETLHDLPRGFAMSATQKRQVKSVRSGKPVIERGLRGALRAVRRPIAFVDFETVGPAVPVWPACRPYQAVPVQLSCHVLGKDGGLSHREWLADGSDDPRPSFARALIDACAGAKAIVVYSGFEDARIKSLIEAVPALASDLQSVRERIVDLLPIVRDHLYHPGFHGSFSIKSVLPALDSSFGYDDLEIQDGQQAAAALEWVLAGQGPLDGATPDRSRLRAALLAYCKRDTEAMVRLVDKLSELVGAA